MIFQNLYGRWYTNGEDFSVECMVDNGVIVKIEAKRIEFRGRIP